MNVLNVCSCRRIFQDSYPAQSESQVRSQSNHNAVRSESNHISASGQSNHTSATRQQNHNSAVGQLNYNYTIGQLNHNSAARQLNHNSLVGQSHHNSARSQSNHNTDDFLFYLQNVHQRLSEGEYGKNSWKTIIKCCINSQWNICFITTFLWNWPFLSY